MNRSKSSKSRLFSQIHNLLNPRSRLNKEVQSMLKDKIKNIYYKKFIEAKKSSNKKMKTDEIVKKLILKMISNKTNSSKKMSTKFDRLQKFKGE